MFESLIGLLATVAVCFLLEESLLYVGDLIIGSFLGWMSWSGTRAFNGRPAEERESALDELRAYAKDRWREERTGSCSLVFAVLRFIWRNGRLLSPRFQTRFVGLLVDCPQPAEEPDAPAGELAAEPDGKEPGGISLYKAPEPSDPAQWGGGGGLDPGPSLFASLAGLQGGNRDGRMSQSEVRAFRRDSTRRLGANGGTPDVARSGFAPGKVSADDMYMSLKGQVTTSTEPGKKAEQGVHTSLGMVCKDQTIAAARRRRYDA